MRKHMAYIVAEVEVLAKLAQDAAAGALDHCTDENLSSILLHQGARVADALKQFADRANAPRGY